MSELEKKVSRKYIKTKEVSDWLIDTESGWKDINSVSKTVKYKVWKLKTFSGKELKCADDHIVFYKNLKQVFVKDLKVNEEIITVDGLERIEELKCLEYEDEMYDFDIDSNNKSFYTNGILSHNSTVVSLYILWYAMFSVEPVNIFILGNKAKTAQGILKDIKLAYEEIEDYIKRGVEEYNKTSIEFDNRSVIQTGATTKDSIRSESVSFLLLDEFAHIQQHIAEEFYEAALPTASTGGKICIVSTPKGNSGKFYEIFTGANKKGEEWNEFVPFSMDWKEVPGRDENFKRKMINASSLQSWYQEYEAKFLGSSNTLVNGEALERINKTVNQATDEYENWKCWGRPIRDHIYVLGADVAKGTENDYSVMQILDITNMDKVIKQSAVFADNKIDPFDFAEEIYKMGVLYNNAYVIVENNTYGHEVCRRLYEELEYENLFKEKKKKKYGIFSNVRTKSLATSLLKKYIEKKTLIINDIITFNELSGFVQIKPDVYKCEKGKYNHDDRVMALAWACFFLGSDFWREWKEYAVRDIDENNSQSGIYEEQNNFQPLDIAALQKNEYSRKADDDGFVW